MEEAEVERLIAEARESMEAATIYRTELQHRLRGLSQARSQIEESAAHTRETLRQHFQDMKSAVCKMLDDRLAVLLQQVEAIEHDNIKPLDDCQKLLEHGVGTAEDLLREGG
ncbi:cytokine receptor-like factor 3 [Mantella aurantiaca]